LRQYRSAAAKNVAVSRTDRVTRRRRWRARSAHAGRDQRRGATGGGAAGVVGGATGYGRLGGHELGVAVKPNFGSLLLPRTARPVLNNCAANGPVLGAGFGTNAAEPRPAGRPRTLVLSLT
jgi:hypothetical protein